MYTAIDKHDLLLTATESLEEIARAIETLALDTIYAYVEDGELQVQFRDESRILAKGDPETGELILDAPGHHLHFTWDDTEETWYAKDLNRPLAPVMEKLLTEHAAQPIVLDLDT